MILEEQKKEIFSKEMTWHLRIDIEKLCNIYEARTNSLQTQVNTLKEELKK